MTGTAERIATLFGVGRAPFAPGTVASALALLPAWMILSRLGLAALSGATLGASLLGLWACEIYARAIGNSDPSECVVDELAGQWLACLFAPLTLSGFTLAFVLFRFFDVTKLWPVSAAERLPGGWGIMTDDLVAGLLAGFLVAGATRLGLV
jgi:phosphatidylglycerophosphatase A